VKVFHPFKMLSNRLGAKRVDQIHGRFRCQQCGGRPVRVAVTDNPARGLPYPDAWSVTLVDATAGASSTPTLLGGASLVKACGSLRADQSLEDSTDAPLMANRRGRPVRRTVCNGARRT
jgi:hypothetical protein